MSSSADLLPATLDGADGDTLARWIDLPRVELFAEVASTMDVAHALAADGAAAGTLVIADAQTAGRGRAGRRWASGLGSGIWLTLIERPTDAGAIDVLSLRLGLRAADAVEPFATQPVRLKWPNDLYAGDRKLAGVLVEARWRDGRPEWVAIGLGMNVVAPGDVPNAIGLRAGVSRLDVLRAVVPALRAATAERGDLSSAELRAFADRDLALGRTIVAPIAGRVLGLTAAGELRVLTADGRQQAIRHGSLAFASDEEGK